MIDLRKINDEQHLHNKFPEISVGDIIEVTTKNLEENDNKRFKICNFKGTVISQKNINSISRTFVVLWEHNKVVIESIFRYYSPLIQNIKKIGRINKRIRRAKLNYLTREASRKKDNS